MTSRDIARISGQLSRKALADGLADFRRRDRYRENFDTRINRLWKPREAT